MLENSRRRAVLIIGMILVSAPMLCADEFEALRTQILALGALTSAPAMTNAPGYPSDGNLRAIYFDALPWKGNPTKVFAWLGMPENRADQVPGVILVHGGGGTAFKEWVTRWNARGFAAISIAVEGQTDQRVPKEPGAKSAPWTSHAWAGPQRDGIYGDSEEVLADQWMYHAVADTVLANSLLRSLPGVDADKVGLMGISWGGVIASTVVGIDDRFAFAIPTYGCGNLSGAGNPYGRSLGDDMFYQKVWDPILRLERAKMPMLWFSWPEDSHFPLDCQSACYRAAGGPQMVSLVPKMGHGHGPPWRRPESYAFAESVVHEGSPWCRQTDVTVTNGICRVSFTSEMPFDQGVLVSTVDTGITGERDWVESPANLRRHGEAWVVEGQLPQGTTAWFVNAYSEMLCVSSTFQEAQDDAKPTRCRFQTGP